MIKKRIMRSMLLLSCVICISALTQVSIRDQRSKCMGILASLELAWRDDLEYQNIDYSEYILFNGEKAAIDLKSSTIYIPQETEGIEYMWQMEGSLQITAEGCQAYIAVDPSLREIPSSVSLYILDGNGHFSHYNVVFTTLPVLRLDGEYLYTEEETSREVMSGTVSVWTQYDPDLESSSAKSGLTHWHTRGYTTEQMKKKSLKLSLKKESGENRNEAFLGLGSDDDWILNSLSMDDTKLKENFLVTIWNEIAAKSDWNLKMSTGQFVEAVIDGEYRGLHLLQRRIDGKYLELGPNDLLFKGGNLGNAAGSYAEGCELKVASYEEAAAFALLEDAIGAQTSAAVSIDNFVDVNLFLDFASAMDNAGYKNMYYALCQENGRHVLSFIPWDMDMSLGVVFDDVFQVFAYHYDTSLGNTILRMEYGVMLEKYPDLHSRMCIRWQELRQTVLQTENIQSVLTELEEQITDGGAFARDRQCWGTYYDEADTVENLKRFIEDRLAVLDARYAQ